MIIIFSLYDETNTFFSRKTDGPDTVLTYNELASGSSKNRLFDASVNTESVLGLCVQVAYELVP